MKNLLEVNRSFEPTIPPKGISMVGRQVLLRTEIAFRGLAQDLVDFMPASQGREEALHKLLKVKEACTAILSSIQEVAAPIKKEAVPTPSLKEAPHGKAKRYKD